MGAANRDHFDDFTGSTVDMSGVIRYKHVAFIGATFRKSGELAGELATLS